MSRNIAGHYEGKTPYSYAYSCAHGAFMTKNTRQKIKRKLDLCCETRMSSIALCLYAGRNYGQTSGRSDR